MLTRWRAGLTALLMLAAALLTPPAAALDYPARPSGPILDQANLLPPAEEAALDARLREYDARTGRAVIVATVNSLGGETIERYATQLYETWGIGGEKRDTGVLLLVAPSERKVRIEVGYGLTPYITDILSGRIVRDDITPRFKQGDFAGGIEAGVDEMIAQLDRSPEDAKAIAEAAAAAERDRGAGPAGAGTVMSGVFWIALLLLFMFSFGRRGARRRRRRYGVGSAVGDIILWNAIGSAMSHSSRDSGGGWGGGFGGGGGGGGGFGGFGGGMSGGGGASGSW